MKLSRARLLVAALPMALFACSDNPSSGIAETEEDTTPDATVDPFGPDSESDALIPTDGSSTDDAGDVSDSAGGGAIGDPCDDNPDCASNLCLPLGGGAGVCSDYCIGDETCPEGFECTIWDNLGEDFVTICVPTDYCFDPDGDLYGDGPGCRGPDCVENAEEINAGAPEICDGVDNDCDGQVDDQADGTLVNCDTGFAGVCSAGRTQCVDGSLICVAFETPGDETCNGLDDDCDGEIDNNPVSATIWYADVDNDRFGDESTAIAACVRPEGTIADAGDCDDNDRTINPTVPESCDGVDNDCDGEIDEEGALGERRFYLDEDNDGYGQTDAFVVACTAPEGYVELDNDCDDADDAINPAAAEICDNIDNDCNDVVDDGSGPEAGLWYLDNDGDTWGEGTDVIYSCAAVPGRVNRAGDCNDNNELVNPGQIELCNGVDDNCVGGIDEGVLLTFYADTDSDGRGDPLVSETGCTPSAGYVANANDCNDEEPAAWTGRAEICDGIDNNCSGQIDEGVTTTYYLDSDSDGRGDPAISRVACTAPAGFVDNAADCNDEEPAAWTGRAEICDGIDNNCSGQIDEGVGTIFYADVDGDAFGDPANTRLACTTPVGFVSNSTDCDDNNNLRYPGLTESCDGIDNNCNSIVDETVTSTFYRDEDNDTFGDALVTIQACSQPAGYVSNTGDCNDKQPAAWTGRTEICDNIDNDCNGLTDEGAGSTFYQDNDLDTYGGTPIVACSQPPGTVTRGGDCNDAVNTINPGRSELCSTPFDDDCDGQVNESSASDASVWYFDEDGDGQGAFVPIAIPPPVVRACTKPADFRVCFLFFCSDPIGYVTDTRDCDDSTARARVGGGPEVCDGYDNDCNGTRDDGFTRKLTYCRDRDGDGNGDPSTRITVCAYPIDADPGDWVVPCTDTDDNN